MKIKAILFDLDGILVEACDWHYISLNRALKELIGFELSRQEHLTTFNGLPTKSKLEILASQGRVSREDFSAIEELKQKYTEEIIQKLSFDPSKILLCSSLQSWGLMLGCVTNCSPETAVKMLNSIGVYSYLKVLITNRDISSPKPAPDGYNLAMARLNVLPTEVIIYEDSDKGMESAQAASPNAKRCVTQSLTLDKVKRDLREYL